MSGITNKPVNRVHMPFLYIDDSRDDWYTIGMVPNKSAAVKLSEYFSQFPATVVSENATLLQPGDTVSKVYFLEEGFIRQYSISDEGEELTLHLYKPGSFMPLLLSLNELENRFYFSAFTPVKVRTAPVDLVISMLEANPDLLLDLSSRLLAGLNGLLHRIEMTAFGTAQTRVANGILYLARHFGEEKDGALLIQQPFTHKNLSHFIGLSRETTSLEIEKLHKMKVLDRQGSIYIIRDKDKLEAIASY